MYAPYQDKNLMKLLGASDEAMLFVGALKSFVKGVYSGFFRINTGPK